MGLMRLPLVQYIAAKVYDYVRPRGELFVNVEGNKLYLRPKDRQSLLFSSPMRLLKNAKLIYASSISNRG